MTEASIIAAFKTAMAPVLAELAALRARLPAPGASPAEVAPEHYDAKQACIYLQCHPNSLTKWIKRGWIKVDRAGNRLRFRREYLDAFLRRRK